MQAMNQFIEKFLSDNSGDPILAVWLLWKAENYALKLYCSVMLLVSFSIWKSYYLQLTIAKTKADDCANPSNELLFVVVQCI